MQRGPRPSMVAGLAAVIGLSVGAATALSELMLRPVQFGQIVPESAAPSGPLPKAVVAEVDYDFGQMNVGQKSSHRFAVTNEGDAPLELTKGATSCTCTISGLEQSSIAPGETADVTLEWKAAAGGPGGEFRQQALIMTNDPRRPEISLSIHGNVFALWDPFPSEIVFSDLQSDAVSTATVKVATFGNGPPRLEWARVSQESNVVTNPVDQPTDAIEAALEVQESPYFTVSTEPLSSADVAKLNGATGGFLFTVTSVPPLPMGPLTNQLEAVFTFPGQTGGASAEGVDGGFNEDATEEDAAQEAAAAQVDASAATPVDQWLIKVAVKANVAGPLSVAGAIWDATREIVRIGSISSASGYQASIFLTAKGEHRHEVRPVVVETVPDSLKVEVGEPASIGDGVVVRIPVSISIPAGSPTCNHLGSQQGRLGRIVLETGHPDAPRLTIPVRVAISP